jgi:hypothetical protein
MDKDNDKDNDKDKDLDDDLDDLFKTMDSSWIEELENLDKEYKDYYTEELTVVKIHCIYVNKNNEIEKLLEDKLILKTPGLLSKEEIVSLIKHNMVCNQVKYSLLYILKFNINLDPIYLKTFIKSKDPISVIGSQFLRSVKNIDTIKFDKSISMFHDLNDLLIIFYNKGPVLTDHDRSETRKIYLNSSSFKKTKRNIFKDNPL